MTWIFITIQHFMNRPGVFPITSGGCAQGYLGQFLTELLVEIRIVRKTKKR